MPEERPQLSPRMMIGLIMGGLVFWALYVAAGVYFYDFNIAKAFAVLICMAIFVGFWLLLLWTQGKTPKP